MNLYEAIHVRKTVRKYAMTELPGKELDRIRRHFSDVTNLFGNIDTDMVIFDNRKGNNRVSGLLGLKAPYYLVFYSEEKPKYMMNLGYLMQQMALYLCTRGLGACFVRNIHLKKEQMTLDGKKAVCALAFGKSKEAYIRKASEAYRMPLEKICTFREQPRQWVRQMVEAARMAPSRKNRQPWRFVVFDNCIHIYTTGVSSDQLNMAEELSFGALFANLLVAGEELWLELDLIRLDSIAQNQYKPEQYLLSVVLIS
ncbi:MAG: nitroreductase family protein [Lachnospiraceae bacterium]|nr:nitroreductase family protein [Lachnospiraceae bacterium]